MKKCERCGKEQKSFARKNFLCDGCKENFQKCFGSCSQIKPLSEFGWSIKSKNILQLRCKVCRSIESKKEIIDRKAAIIETRLCDECNISKRLPEFWGDFNICRECSQNIKNSKEYKICEFCLQKKKSNEFNQNNVLCKKCFETHKKCSGKCGEIKLRDEFALKRKGILRGKCIDCYRELNPVKIRPLKKVKEKIVKIPRKISTIEDQKTKKREYYLKNKERIIKNDNIRNKDRRKNDPQYRIKKDVSRSINGEMKKNGFSKGGVSCWKFLEYTAEEIKIYIESLFEPWMSWSNQGHYNSRTWDDNDPSTWKWQLDHIIPHSLFEYKSMESQEFKDCWSLKNLKPISAKENIKKGNKIPKSTELPEYIIERLKNKGKLK